MGKKILSIVIGAGTLILATVIIVMLAESQTLNLIIFNQIREYTILLSWMIFSIAMTASEITKGGEATNVLLDMLAALIISIVMFKMKGLWLASWQNLEFYFKTICWYGVAAIVFSTFISDVIMKQIKK